MTGSIDTSTLGVSVDTTDLLAANKALDDFTAKAGIAEAAINKLGTSSSSATAAVKNAADATSAQAVEAQKAAVAVKATADAIDKANATEQRRITIVQQSAIVESARSKAERESEAATRSGTGATESAAQADARRVTSLRAAQAAADAFRASETARATAQAGAAAQAEKSAASNDKVKQSSDKAKSGLDGVSLASSGVTREFGVMIAEISRGDFTRLQASLITLANRSGILALAFSPIGVAVAATAASLGILVAGMIEGSSESDKLNKSIILTNNAVGLLRDNLQDTGKQIGDTTGKFGTARDAIQSIVGSGVLFSTGIEQLGVGVSNWATLTGKSTDDVVKDFQKLQDEPTKAVVELNDKYHFLTLAVYEQIAALEQQGKTAEAAGIAQKAYADDGNAKIKELHDSLGSVERDWLAIKDAASRGWDAIKDVGRKSTITDQISDINRQIEIAQNPLTKNQQGYGGGGLGVPGPSDSDLKDLYAKRAKLQGDLIDSDLDAQSKALTSAQAKQNIQYEQQWNDRTKQYESNAQKFARDKAKINAQYSALKDDPSNQSADKQADLTKQYQQQIADLQKQFKPEGGSTYSASLSLDVSQYTNALKGLTADQQKYTAMLKNERAEGSVSDAEYYATQADYIKDTEQRTVDLLNQEKAALETHKGNAAQNIEIQKKLADVDQQISDAHAASIKQQADLNTQQIDDERKTSQAILAIRQQAADFDTARQQTNSRALNAIGQGGDTAKLQQALDQVSDKYNKLRDNATKAFSAPGGGGLDTDKAKQAFTELDDLEKAQVQKEKDYAAQRVAAQGDWVNGFNRAIDDYQAKANDVASAVAQGVTSSAQAAEDALVNLYKTGKLNLDKLLEAVLDTFLKIETQKQVSGIAGLLGDAVNTYFGGGSTPNIDTGSAASNVSIDTGSFALAATANGGVMRGGSLVRTPRLVPMANGGTNLRGEAGSEGVFPLTQTSDGKLGIAAVGSGSTVNVNVHNYAGAQVQTQQKSNGQGGFDIDVIVTQIEAKMANNMSQGRGNMHDAVQTRFGLNTAQGLG